MTVFRVFRKTHSYLHYVPDEWLELGARRACAGWPLCAQTCVKPRKSTVRRAKAETNLRGGTRV